MGLLDLAASLLIGIGLNHSVMGERFIVVKILQWQNLPGLLGSHLLMRRIIRASWHLITLHWWMQAALIAIFRNRERIGFAEEWIGRSLLWTNVATALVLLLVTRGKHFSWPVFSIIAVCVWFGWT